MFFVNFPHAESISSGNETRGERKDYRFFFFFFFSFEARTDRNTVCFLVSIYLKRNGVSPRPKRTAL